MSNDSYGWILSEKKVKTGREKIEFLMGGGLSEAI